MPRKRVLVTPLDWGYGHASRCMPIIRSLLTKNIDVVIAGSGQSLQFLRQEFPQIKAFSLPAYSPKYSAGSMVWTMARQIPKFIRAIRKEHVALQYLIRAEQIDLVISDSRFGCWSDLVPSYFVTHQTNIQMPPSWRFIQGLVNFFNRQQIRKFKACLVVDKINQKYSGCLSDHPGLNVKHIGILSRFIPGTSLDYRYDILVILSGPEPQRSMLEKLLIDQLITCGKKVLLVRGVNEQSEISDARKIEIVNFLNSDDLQRVLNESQVIISRSGYSTVMDLARIGKKAIFIPTPEQTEQEYIAKRMMKLNIAYSAPQNKFNLEQALVQSSNFSGFESDYDNTLLDTVISELIL